MGLFEIQNLSFRYPSHADFELKNVDLHIEKGSLVGFLGANGAGKSTLLKLMAALLVPRAGQALWRGIPVGRMPGKERAKKIAFVPQATSFAFPLGVREIVEMGRHPYLGRFQSIGPEDRKVCDHALELCDALEFEDRSYDELSGGEKQRVLLASALAQTPEALLLDEPTLSLDLSHQVLLFEIIHKLHRERGLTVIVATHEINLAARYLDRLVLMKQGRIEAQGSPERVMTEENIRRVHGVEVDRLTHAGDFPYFVPKRGGNGGRP